MAKLILAASDAARNNKYVPELLGAFDRVLRVLSEQPNDCKLVNDYLRAIRTLLDLAYKALTENGLADQVKAYHQNLRVYTYYCSIFEQKQYTKLAIKFDDIIENMAQSLVNIVTLARDNFYNLGYPDYYQEFAHAVDLLLVDHRLASNAPDAANLAMTTHFIFA